MRRGIAIFAAFFLVIMMFSACGTKNDTQNVAVDTKKEKITNSTFEKEKSIIMYASDGRTRETPESQVEDYRAVGWYTEPVCIMYAADGRTRVTPDSQVEDYKAVGWYTEPVCTMYSADGRTQIVLQSQIEANKAVGWYTQPVIPSLTELCSYKWKRNGITLSACYEYTFFTDGEYECNGIATGYLTGKYNYDNGILKIYYKNSFNKFEYNWEKCNFVNPDKDILAERSYRDENGVFHDEVYEKESLVKGDRTEPIRKPKGLTNLSEYVDVYNACCLNHHYIDTNGKAIDWPYDREYWCGDFYEVDDPNISTIQELKDHLLKYLTVKTVEKYTSSWYDDMPPVLERDGHLYVEYPAHGSCYIVSDEGRITDSYDNENKIVYTFPLYNSGDQYCEDVTVTFVKENGVYKIEN